MQIIKNVPDLVEALDGTTAVAELFDIGPSAVSNWKAENALPAYTSETLKDALDALGLRADPSLWPTMHRRG